MPKVSWLLSPSPLSIVWALEWQAHGREVLSTVPEHSSHCMYQICISNQSILKETSPEHSLEGLMLKLKLQYFGHLMGIADTLEKTLMLGKIEGGGEGGHRR